MVPPACAGPGAMLSASGRHCWLKEDSGANPHEADYVTQRSLPTFTLSRGGNCCGPVWSRLPQLTKTWDFRVRDPINATGESRVNAQVAGNVEASAER